MRLRRAWAPLALALLAAGCADAPDPVAPAGAAPDGPAAYVAGQTTRVEVDCPGLIAVGSLWACSAYGYDIYGYQTSSYSYGWSSSDMYSLYVYGTGLLDARHPGFFWVYAIVDGVQGNTTVQVYEPYPVVTTVAVSPTSATLQPGGTRAFSATAYDQHGYPMSASFAWSSSNPSVATVSSSGTATAVAPGSATITATAGGKSAGAAVTVQSPPPPPTPRVSISGPYSISAKARYTYTATASDFSGSPSFAWSTRYCGGSLGSCTSWSGPYGGSTLQPVLVPDCSGAGDATYELRVVATSGSQQASDTHTTALCQSAIEY